jgi:hypothetical protein
MKVLKDKGVEGKVIVCTGAAGVLVGFGGGAASTTRATLGIHAPMATAVADVAGALNRSSEYVRGLVDSGELKKLPGLGKVRDTYQISRVSVIQYLKRCFK